MAHAADGRSGGLTELEADATDGYVQVDAGAPGISGFPSHLPPDSCRHSQRKDGAAAAAASTSCTDAETMLMDCCPDDDDVL